MNTANSDRTIDCIVTERNVLRNDSRETSNKFNKVFANVVNTYNTKTEEKSNINFFIFNSNKRRRNNKLYDL